jgi:hypothetical protein
MKKTDNLVVFLIAVAAVAIFLFPQTIAGDKYSQFALQKNIKRIITCVNKSAESSNFSIYQFKRGVPLNFRWIAQWDSESFDWREYSKKSEIDNTSILSWAPDFNAVLVIYSDNIEFGISELDAGYLNEGDSYFTFFHDRDLINGEGLRQIVEELGSYYQSLSIHRFYGRVFVGIREEDRVFHAGYACNEINDHSKLSEQLSSALLARDQAQADQFKVLSTELDAARKF